MNVWHKI